MEQNNLHECEKSKFKAIAAAANDAIILMGQKEEVTFWNGAAEKIFGYSSEEMLGKNLHETLTPEKYRELQNKNFDQFIRTGTGNAIGKTVEVEAIRKNGEIFPVELSLSALKINGKWNALGIVRDISQRKSDEEKLLRQKEKFDYLLKNLNDLVFETDSKGKIIFANKIAEKFFDKPLKEVYGSKIYQYFDKNGLLIILNKYKEFKNHTGEPIFISHELTLKNGKIVQINLTIVFDKNGILNTLGVARDITQQKQTERELNKYKNNLEKLLESRTSELIKYQEQLEEMVEKRTLQLKESEEKYRNLLDNSDDPIIQINENSKFTYANKKVEELTSTPSESFFGKSCFELGFSKEVSEKMNMAIKHAIEEKEKIRIELQTPNDKWIDFCFVPELDRQGKVTSVLATGRDITDRRNREKELQARSHELELFNKTMINREMRIIELKKEINSLSEKLGMKKPYEEIWNKKD